MTKTKTDVQEAYSGVINTQALLDVIGRSTEPLEDGDLVAVCAILSRALDPARDLLDHLVMGYEIEPENSKKA